MPPIGGFERQLVKAERMPSGYQRAVIPLPIGQPQERLAARGAAEGDFNLSLTVRRDGRAADIPGLQSPAVTADRVMQGQSIAQVGKVQIIMQPDALPRLVKGGNPRGRYTFQYSTKPVCGTRFGYTRPSIQKLPSWSLSPWSPP